MYQSTEPCPRCGAQNLRGTWVCPQCGTTLVIYCPACHAGNVTGSQFCHACGSPLSATGQAPTHPADQHTPQYAATDYQAGSQQPYPGGYGAQGGQQYYQPYQQYPEYGGYAPQPPHGGMPGQGMLDGFVGRLKQIVVTTNPILLSSLVILVVGLGVFLLLAFQLHWIKTPTSTKPTTTTTATSKKPQISFLQVQPGDAQHSAVISWVTDQYSSSQVQYGITPTANTLTPIEDDPSTGVSKGVLKHDVTLTNLAGGSSYSYKVISINKDGAQAESDMQQFYTTQ